MGQIIGSIRIQWLKISSPSAEKRKKREKQKHYQEHSIILCFLYSWCPLKCLCIIFREHTAFYKMTSSITIQRSTPKKWSEKQISTLFLNKFDSFFSWRFSFIRLPLLSLSWTLASERAPFERVATTVVILNIQIGSCIAIFHLFKIYNFSRRIMCVCIFLFLFAHFFLLS